LYYTVFTLFPVFVQVVLKTKMEEEQKATTGLAGVLASISTDTGILFRYHVS